MTWLYGKGVWTIYSLDVEHAIEMAAVAGGTHILVKTGHRTMYFPASAPRACARVRAAGLTPLAWFPIRCESPADEARVALKSLRAGYAGVVFWLEPEAASRGKEAARLGRRLLDEGVNPAVLCYTSFPAPPRRPDIPYAEMAGFCQGGFMPATFATLGKPAEVVIHKLAYEEFTAWAAARHIEVSLYPVLSGHRDEQGAVPLPPDEFAHWLDVLAEHRPPFFSLFHAGAVPRTLWEMMADQPAPEPPVDAGPPAPFLPVEETPPSPPPPPSQQEAEEEAVYVTVQLEDTVARLCRQHGIPRAQFWEWNGHLWDDLGWPRDANYMQPGWQVRVG